VPEAITQLQGQLDQFRSSQPRRTPLPESLWQAAVELARQHGVYAVASPLRLDYTRLKQRLNGAPSPSRQATKPAFVELIPQSGRRPRHPIGAVCCAPGNKAMDDSEHCDHAGAGSHRAIGPTENRTTFRPVTETGENVPGRVVCAGSTLQRSPQFL